MKYYHFPCLFFLFLFLCYQSIAQEFGGNPASIKWKQINTDTVRIIFAEGMEESGKQAASIIHELQRNHTSTIGNKLRKINIVLQNQTAVSNGYVALGPYRSEFYLFSPQNSFELGAINWVDNLSLHEYRHVQQVSNFNVGISKLAGILFGQQGQDLANSTAIPNWFFEGDAVFNETSLSHQGRGRLPDFFNGYQSLFHQQKHYSYMKLRNGSLKNYVPDHYKLGYMLVSYGREKYGADFWKKVTHDAARFKPLIYPFQGALKKHAGVSYNQFVNDAFSFYQKQWKENNQKDVHYLTPVQKNVVTDYKYPYMDSLGDIIVLKTGNRIIPAFYRIYPDGVEMRIGSRGIANDDYFSYNNGNIVFASYKADKRWGYRQYSNIKIMDAATGAITKITTKERYFSPDISHDGKMIIAVNIPVNQTSSLVAMDTQGKVLYKSKTSRGVIYSFPKFLFDDLLIYAIAKNDKGEMALLKINMASGKETAVLPYANRIIGLPTVKGDTVLFTCSYKGSNEIWAYVGSNEKFVRVATHPTGYYQAALGLGDKRIVTSNFTANGYRLAALSNKELLWQTIDEKENSLPNLYVPAALKVENDATLENIPNRTFDITKYRKGFHLFNFHSWRPNYDDPEITYSLLGENVLNTLQSDVSYTYNRNEGSHKAGASFIYGGWYVQPTFKISQTWNRKVAYNGDTSFFYNELNVNAGLRLPLDFSEGNHYTFLTLSTTFNNQQVRWSGIGKGLLQNQDFNYWEGRVQYNSQIQKAPQHIFPHWAQSVLLQQRGILNKYTAHQTLLSGYFYLPGFLKSHSIVLTAAFQMRDTMNQYYFSNSFPFSRGYPGFNYPRMSRLGANYHFTLFYPDLGFANIVYCKRIRANVFYDYAQIKSLRSGKSFSFTSTGTELFFDTKWWNQQDVSFGIRYSYLMDNKIIGIASPHQWEIILPIGLF